MRSIDVLIEGNLEFSGACNKEKMKKLSLGQSPKILWIGCSDSRVCPETITNVDLGNIFVHRNIANQVSTRDLNGLSVIEYAVKFLKVDTIIVCGHTGCGGVKASLEGLEGTDYIGEWIKDLSLLAKKTKQSYPELSLEALESKLLELNITQQINCLKELPIVKEALKENVYLNLYGCLFDIAKGKLEMITTVGGRDEN